VGDRACVCSYSREIGDRASVCMYVYVIMISVHFKDYTHTHFQHALWHRQLLLYCIHYCLFEMGNFICALLIFLVDVSMSADDT
jgi:hypothetical protein